MASFVVVLGLAAIAFGAALGSFLVLARAISWEDRRRGSLRLDAPSNSTRVARSLVGITGMRDE